MTSPLVTVLVLSGEIDSWSLFLGERIKVCSSCYVDSMLRGLEQNSQRWQHEYRRRNFFFFLGLVYMMFFFFRLIPNHLHLPYDCWVTPSLFVINTESPSLSVLLHLSIEQIKLRLTAYLSMFTSS